MKEKENQIFTCSNSLASASLSREREWSQHCHVKKKENQIFTCSSSFASASFASCDLCGCFLGAKTAYWLVRLSKHLRWAQMDSNCSLCLGRKRMKWFVSKEREWVFYSLSKVTQFLAERLLFLEKRIAWPTIVLMTVQSVPQWIAVLRNRPSFHISLLWGTVDIHCGGLCNIKTLSRLSPY